MDAAEHPRTASPSRKSPSAPGSPAPPPRERSPAPATSRSRSTSGCAGPPPNSATSSTRRHDPQTAVEPRHRRARVRSPQRLLRGTRLRRRAVRGPRGRLHDDAHRRRRAAFVEESSRPPTPSSPSRVAGVVLTPVADPPPPSSHVSGSPSSRSTGVRRRRRRRHRQPVRRTRHHRAPAQSRTSAHRPLHRRDRLDDGPRPPGRIRRRARRGGRGGAGSRTGRLGGGTSTPPAAARDHCSRRPTGRPRCSPPTTCSPKGSGGLPAISACASPSGSASSRSTTRRG